MSDHLLVNSIYPLIYFSLDGVQQITHPDTGWWSSLERFASINPANEFYLAQADGGTQTQEVLEIDLGRVRSVNYTNFDILRAPITIKIEYDVVSSPTHPHSWVTVQPRGDLPFDSATRFEPTNRNAWQNMEFSFEDPKGHPVLTRYLRITFYRRDEKWPLEDSVPFKWPVFIKHLRIGQFIAEPQDTIGTLFLQDPNLDDLIETTLIAADTTTSTQARQQFVIPEEIVVGTTPNITGFGFLANATTDENQSNSASWRWEIFDVSGAPLLLLTGTEMGVVADGQAWIDVIFQPQDFLAGDLDKVYEVRLTSLNTDVSDIIYLSHPNTLSQITLPGTYNHTNGSVTLTTVDTDPRDSLVVGQWIVVGPDDTSYQIGALSSSSITLTTTYSGTSGTGDTITRIFPSTLWDEDTLTYVANGNYNVAFRLWGDTGASGQDVLGNTYRYDVQRESATNVVDATKAGWMSDPMPSPDAVESLYFDVRSIDPLTNKNIYRVIEALRIAPRTPGVKMNIYYSKDNLFGDTPKGRDEWDYLIWTPVANNSFTLRRNEVLEFPTPVRASFIKLEFTSLRPLPINLPIFPPPPPKEYRRFPTWIEDQFTNSGLRNTIEDWWLRSSTPVQIQTLQALSDPILEFEYKEAQFFAALAAGRVTTDLIGSNLVDLSQKAVIDPITGSKIYIEGIDAFQNSLLISVDQNTVLGQAVVARYDSNTVRDPVERLSPFVPLDPINTVSFAGDRVSDSYSFIAQVPMRFNKTCRHIYRVQEAEFNKKAFFVGIDEVQFLRKENSVADMGTVISDLLYDDDFLEINTWTEDPSTTIDDLQNLYVTYRIDDTQYTDELVTLVSDVPWLLEGRGGFIYDIYVYSSIQKQGLQYFQNDDYLIQLGRDADGLRTYSIAKSPQFERLITPEQPIIYIDAGTVTGVAVIPSPPTVDAGTVTGVASITSAEVYVPYQPEYGQGEYGEADGEYDNLAGI